MLNSVCPIPDGVNSRTEAIQHRIESAGIKRKIAKNQVRALHIMLSYTSENMKQIEVTGKLDYWCRENINWLKETFGCDNLVLIVLHMDKKTPHIHVTVILIVRLCRSCRLFPVCPFRPKYVPPYSGFAVKPRWPISSQRSSTDICPCRLPEP